MPKKVGIITYHAAYNYGSVLQAYATQEFLKRIGMTPQIINYRMDEQKRCYSLYRTSYGAKVLLKDLEQLPIHAKRAERVKRFEEFISSSLDLTEEFSDPNRIIEVATGFDVLLSGSDQIWNKHSNELWNVDWKYMDPFFFVGCEGKKVSYASSVGNMTDTELEMIKGKILDFANVSMREESAAKRIRSLFNMPVATVPDPTFLLTSSDWDTLVNDVPHKQEKFFFFYSLHGVKMIQLWKPVIEELSYTTGLKAIAITPSIYSKYKSNNIENHPEFGPYDFLAAIRDCEFVMTDSFHGTALALNYGKPLLSIMNEGGSEYRKADLLATLGKLECAVKDSRDVKAKIERIDKLIVNSESVEALRQTGARYIETEIF